jgi:hypothetical protein
MTISAKLTAGAVATTLLLSFGGAASANTSDASLNANETAIAKVMVLENDKFAGRISNQIELLLKLAEKEGKPFRGSGAKVYSDARKKGYGTPGLVKNVMAEVNQTFEISTVRYTTRGKNGSSKVTTISNLKYGGENYVSNKTNWSRTDVSKCQVALRSITRNAERALSANYNKARAQLIKDTRNELKTNKNRFSAQQYASYVVAQIDDYQLWAVNELQRSLVTGYLGACGGWTKVK